MLVLTAGLLPVILGMAALAVDLGGYAADRRSVQNAADSIALAAARDLPDVTAAQASAQSWATKNHIAANQYSLQITTSGSNPTVRVTISKPHDFAFIKILGIDETDLGARASAGKYSFGGSAGIVPWSVTQATLDAASPGSQVVLKYDATGGSNGNFGAIRIDGNGASDYEAAATYGSSSVICAVGTPNCTVDTCEAGGPCAENAPECEGPECAPKTGNMTGPTQDAVDFRMSHTSQACDTFDEVFTPLTAYAAPGDAELLAFSAGFGGRLLSPPEAASDAPALPAAPPAPAGLTTSSPTDQYALNQDCNPWTAGACPPAPSTIACSRRVIIIPVIDAFGNGSSDPVTIQKFALVYLDGYDFGNCSGNSCEIKARFVNANLTTGALAGAYDPNASVQFTKLIE